MVLARGSRPIRNLHGARRSSGLLALAVGLGSLVAAGACGDGGGDGDPSAMTSSASDSDPSGPSVAADTSTTAPASGSATDTVDEVDGTAATTATDGPITGGWETRASLPGGPRQETGVAALAGEVYVVGGFAAGGALVATVEAYDPRRDTWRETAALPQPLHHANLAAVEGRLFIAGYLVGLSFSAQGEVLSYDPAADTWSMAHAAMPTGTERGASAVAVFDDRIYLFGGFRGGALDDVWAYDVSLDLWDMGAGLPGPRDHVVAETIGDRIYVVGGRDGAIDSHTAQLDVYDPTTDSWTPGPPMPTSRGGMMAAVLEGRLFVAGGEGNEAEASGVFAQLEVYDPGAGVWATLEPMPTPRHGTGAAAIGDVLYVPGGATVEAFGAVPTHEAWRLE